MLMDDVQELENDYHFRQDLEVAPFLTFSHSRRVARRCFRNLSLTPQSEPEIICPLIRPFVYPVIPSSSRPFILPYVHLFIHSPCCPFISSSIHPLILRRCHSTQPVQRLSPAPQTTVPPLAYPYSLADYLRNHSLSRPSPPENPYGNHPSQL